MIGKQLVYFRKKQGFSQEDIAHRLNVARSTYTNWEKDRSEPDISTMIRICDIYHISLDNLVGRTYRIPPQIEVILNIISDLETEEQKRVLNHLVEYSYLVKGFF